jgi:hypothetical protein
MLTVRTVVVIFALGASGVAASSARRFDHLSVPAGTSVTSAVAHPAIADEHTTTIKSAPAAMASTSSVRRVTAPT